MVWLSINRGCSGSVPSRASRDPCCVDSFLAAGVESIGLYGAEGGNRTHTLLPEPDFESGASTSSATPARERASIRIPRAVAMASAAAVVVSCCGTMPRHARQ